MLIVSSCLGFISSDYLTLEYFIFGEEILNLGANFKVSDRLIVLSFVGTSEYSYILSGCCLICLTRLSCVLWDFIIAAPLIDILKTKRNLFKFYYILF